MIDKTTLDNLLEYNPKTGELIWRPRPESMFSAPMYCRTWNTKNAGKVAGNKGKNGYRYIGLLNKVLLAHRVIATMQGWPIDGMQIDHINGDRMDNRLGNLRVVTNQENGKNQKKRITNTTGVNGVYRDSRPNRRPWYVRYGDNGYGGSFDTFEEAVAVRMKIENDLNYHELHGTKKGP